MGSQPPLPQSRSARAARPDDGQFAPRGGASMGMRAAWPSRRCAATPLILALMLACAAPLAPSKAMAQAEGIAAARRYDIPAGPLAEVLTRLGNESRLLLIYPRELVEDLRSPGVQGVRDADSALREALRGTGLEARKGTDGYTLRKAPQAGVAELGAVRVSADRDDRIEVFEALGSVGVITREDLDRVPVSSARDIFMGEPGVYVMDGNQDPGINNINIRGIQGPGRINVMIDGTRQNASNYAGYAGQMSRVYVDPELLGGVDIEKGPAGGMYGAGVTGGVVNLRTLGAEDLIQGEASHGGRLRVIHGNNGYNTAAMAAGAFRLDNGLAITAGVSRRKSDNYRAGKRKVPEDGYPHCNARGQAVPGCDSEVPLTHQDMVSGLLKAQYRINAAHHIEAGATYYQNTFASWARGVAVDESMGYPEQKVRANTQSLRYRWNPPGNTWVDLNASIWRADNRTAYEMFGEQYDLNTVGGEISNTARIALGASTLTLNAGGEFYLDKADTHANGRTTESRSGLGREGLTASGKRNIGGWFAQASLAYRDWLQFDAGVRTDYFGLRASGSYASPYAGQSPNTFSMNRSGGRVNPNVALGITPVEGVQLFARYAEGQRAPTLSETAGGGAVWSIYHLPNPYLKPEVARTHEFGLNLVLDHWLPSDGKLRLKATRFVSRYDDYITRTSIPYHADVASSYAYIFTNIDQATLRGVELQAQLDLGYLFADLTFNQFDRIAFCSGGVCTSDPGEAGDLTAPFIPPKRTLAATLGVRLIERKLVLGARLRADERRGMTDANQFNDGTYWKPYKVVDLFGSYDISPQLRLAFSVENLADKYYVGAMNFNGLPSPGRSIKGSLTYTF